MPSSPESCSTTPSAADPPVAQTLHVQAGQRRIALDMDAVAAMGQVGPVVPVPGSPNWLRGLTAWRGRLLTLIDAGLLFGTDPIGGGGRLVVLKNVGIDTALLVDDVLGPFGPEEAAHQTLDAAALREQAAFWPGAGGPRSESETST